MSDDAVYRQTFARWLKQRRRALDLTQDQLAEQVGYASPTMQKIERGERRPSREMAERLATVLGIAPEEQAEFLRLARLPAEPVQLSASEKQPSLPIAAVPSGLPLLLSRIQLPLRHAAVVLRPRLTTRLAVPQTGLVTIVVAPAGWGKTTLLSSWLAELSAAARSRVAWLALDANIHEPVELLRYLIAALQLVEPTLGRHTLAVLESTPPSLESALRLVVNDLVLLQQPLTLVLDDYHLLRHEALQGMVRFLVEQLPPMLHLVIASREEPPLPLSRLRAQRKLNEIRAPDLRFQGAEAIALLNEAMGLNLDAPTAAALAQRTEGWATGLQLAALALREQQDPATFIAQFVGSHRLVLDYLTEEVLDRLPKHLLTFLLQTSILERLCGPLCDAVLGLASVPARIEASDSYSQLVFAELERANLFLIPLDAAGHWYRYHHLFGEVLRTRLRRGANPAAVRELQRRAAEWYSSQELWQEALAHAQAAEQWDLVAQALEQLGEDLILQGSLGRLIQIISGLPATTRIAHPRLLLLQSICEFKNYNTATAELLAKETLAAATDQRVRAAALLQLSDCQRTSGNFAAARVSLQAALTGLLAPRTRVQALVSRSFEALTEGDWQATRVAMDAALDLAAAHADHLLRFELAINAHSIFLILPGGLAWGIRFAQLATQWQIPEISPLQASLNWITGYLHLLRGEFAPAAAQIELAMILSAQLGGLNKLVLDAGVQQVFALALNGDLAGAERQVAALFAALEKPEMALYARLFAAGYHYLLGWLRIQQGQHEEAMAIAEEMEAIANSYEWPSSHATRLLLRGLLAIETNSSVAIDLLGQASAEQARFADAFMLGDARVPLAYALLKHDQQAALQTMHEALAAQKERGTPGILLLTGRAIALPLFRLLHTQRLHADLVDSLLCMLGEVPPATAPAPADPAVLTAREIEVLDLIANGESNTTIAIRLVISSHTAKRHVAHILEKLGAQNRTEAVARARERGLL